MADAEFNRTTLTSPTVEPRRPGFGGFGAIFLVVVLAAAGFVGYKIIQSGAPVAAAAQQDRNLAKLQQQLTSIEQRLDHLERRRAATQSALASESRVTVPSPAAAPSPHPDKKHSPDSFEAQSQAPSQRAQTENLAHPEQAPQLTNASSASDTTASREAWQATANQLTDVVGVVGSQQDELSKTQAELGRLAAQAQRFAVPFQLRRGSRPQAVGPVSLQLRNSDARRQRYSIDVFLDEKPVEFKDRAVDELVDFVLPGESVPLRFVATKINHDFISGYMEVPKRGPSR